MNIDLNLIGWKYGILILLIILFFIWAFVGGGDYEFIGLSPLEIGNDASGREDHHRYRKKGKRAQLEPIDNTPNIPDLSNFEAPDLSESYDSFENKFCDSFSISMSFEQPSVGDLVEPYSYEEVKTPRTAALGPHKCRLNGRMSKGEKLCKQAIEEIYGLPFYCVRPNFLKNPETGRNLEIDIYNDSLKIGVEYCGMQHFIFPNSFHKTYEEFINQVRRDQYKVDACDENGVYLITVPYNVPLDLESIKKYIGYYLPENHSKRMEATPE